MDANHPLKKNNGLLLFYTPMRAPTLAKRCQVQMINQANPGWSKNPTEHTPVFFFQAIQALLGCPAGA